MENRLAAVLFDDLGWETITRVRRAWRIVGFVVIWAWIVEPFRASTRVCVLSFVLVDDHNLYLLPPLSPHLGGP